MESTLSDQFSSSSCDTTPRSIPRPAHQFQRPSFRMAFNADLVPAIEINCAPDVIPASPVLDSSQLFKPKKMPWAQSSSQLNRILQKRQSCRRSSRFLGKPPPKRKGKAKNASFVDPTSLPKSHSPTRFGKYLVRVFDGNMHETQIQRLAHTKPKKRGSTLSHLSRQSQKSRNSFLNVESSGECSQHSTPISKYGQSSLASFSIKSSESPSAVHLPRGNQTKAKSISLSKSVLRRLDTSQTIKSELIKGHPRIPNTIKENSIASASTAPSLKRIGLTQSINQNRSRFKSSSFKPPSQRMVLPTQSSFKDQFDLRRDIQSVKHIELFSCKEIPNRRDKQRQTLPAKLRSLSEKLRQVKPCFGIAQRRLNYPNPFIKDLTRRQKELENFSHSTTQQLNQFSSDQPYQKKSSELFSFKSVDLSNQQNSSLSGESYSEFTYQKSNTLSPSFGSDLLDRFTRPSLNQLFTRIANKNSIRIEAQSKLSLCLSKFGL